MLRMALRQGLVIVTEVAITTDAHYLINME